MFSAETLRAPCVLLEDRLSPVRAARLYRDPVAVIRCEAPEDVEAAFARIEDGLAKGLHAAGLFSYELGYALEPKLAGLMPVRRDAPLLWMGLFEAFEAITAEDLDMAFARLAPPAPIANLHNGADRRAHMDRAATVLDLIEAGDAYQVNLTFPLTFEYAGDPLSLYAALRSRQPVAHGGVARLGDMTVLSVSPELWVEIAGDRITTRPMKGTVARATDAGADRAARETLLADPKQRAENLMIVDLLRNDLARIAEPGSVQVPALFTVETYPSFHAMTSTVTGRLAPGHGLHDRVAALFPCGSVVGAPKIRAAEIIRSLEPEPRGFYCGALGAIEPGGDMTFNVAIRTATLRADGRGRYGVGGGVVADSVPAAEYDEAELKGRVLTDLSGDYDLFETFRWSLTDGFVRLSRHLDRLHGSAAQLGFAFDRAAAERALGAEADAWRTGSADVRVRLALSRDGALAITHAPLPAPPGHVLRIGVASIALDAGDPFLRHKTTRRELHERAFAAASADGLDEALLLNHRGEIAEASRNSIFAEIDGQLITPPLTAGVLPGVLRGELIESGKAVERRLTLNALTQAQRLYLGNSLHGLRVAALV
ncbi:MAG TPA: aminodeoxychorismate synthase component I [Caulobacteraceae bacterium]